MPITAENFQRAIQALAKAKSDPNADPARVAKIQANVDQYLAESGQYGPAPASPAVSQPEFSGRGSVAGYFYNPNLDEFRSALKDRSVREKIGLGDNYSSGQTSGESYLKSQVPELSGLGKIDVNQLTEASDEYKRYAEYAYQQAIAKDPSIKRYDDLDIMENPGQKALGAILKYGPAAVIGAERSAAMGIPTALIKSQGMQPPVNPITGQVIAPELTQSAEAQQARNRTARKFGEDVETLASLSPEAETIGSIASYVAPFAPSNIAQRAAATALGYETSGAVGKALKSGLTAAGVGATEGAVQDVTRNPNISAEQLGSNALNRALGGAVLGAGGDIAGQIAGKTQKLFSESPRWQDIKNLRDVGGDTNFITGVSAPKAVKENISKGAQAREYRTAADIAAEKVAPNIRQAVQSRTEQTRQRISKELEDYLNRPDIAAQQESMQPVADNILEMFNKGTFEGALSGDLKHPNAGAVKTFRDVLNTIGEVAHVSPEQAEEFAKANNGRIINPRQAQSLGIQSQEGKVPVYVAAKMPARALLEMEQMIDDRLKMATVEGGANNPVWKEINRSVKQVRDKFGAPKQPEVARAPTVIQEDITNVPTDIRFGEEQNPFSPQEELSFSSVSPPDMTDSEWARFNNPEAKTGVSSPNALPEYVPQDPGRPVNREPSPSDYQTGNYGEGPRQRWEDTLPEANQSLNETGYGDYLKATQADAARQQNFAQSMEGQYWNRPAEMSEKEIDKEVIAILKGEGIDMNITPENRAKVYYALEERGEQFAPYIARLKEIQAKQLAKQQAAGTFVPGQPRESQYEELGSSAIIPDRSSVATGPTEYAAQPSIGQRSAEAAYETGVAVPNQGTFTPSEVSREINQAGGVGAAGKLSKGMREESLNREMSKYVGKSPEEVNQIAENLEYPIDVSIDNGNVMLRDGRHRLEAAKRAGAKNIKVRVRKFNAQGQAEEVTVAALPIERISDAPPAANPSVSPVIGDSVGNPNPDVSLPIPQETLDDGTVVYGLSAMQRRHHKQLEELNRIEQLTGSTEDATHKKVLNFKYGEGHPSADKALIDEAERLGLRQQLEEVPATRDFPQLRAKANRLGGEGLVNAAIDMAAIHLDPVLGAIAGTPPNPFTANPLTPAGRIQQYLFRQGVPMHPLLSGRAGLAGSRFGGRIFNDKEEENK